MSDRLNGPWTIAPSEEPYDNIRIMYGRQKIVELWQDDAPEPEYNREQRQIAQLIAQAWTIPALRDALPNPEKLDLLAAWFDRHDGVLGLAEPDVQGDLRLWAKKARAALALAQEEAE